MAEYPLDHISFPSPTSFAHLLADVWWTLYPNGDISLYQVTLIPIGGSMLEYRAKVLIAVNLPIGMRTYDFQGGFAPTPNCAI